jgi:hypothetical protein
MRAPSPNTLVVSKKGPKDGGDFGPHTPGTKTSGLQEAFDAAKAQGKDLYIEGGSWTMGGAEGAVYVLHETLRIPWMQDFRCDGGHCVIQYVPKKGDAVVIDSQMSCFYRFGLIVSDADGAVLRLAPTTAGPDRFKVFTTTELHVNALVGGGGAWPGGKPFESKLDPNHTWVGTGLLLDATTGPIDANKISVIEVVGCERGVHLVGRTTNNKLEAGSIHLCKTLLCIGGPNDDLPNGNRFEGHLESEGIPAATGADVYGVDNLLTLTTGRMAQRRDVVFQSSARGNTLLGVRVKNGVTHLAPPAANRVLP